MNARIIYSESVEVASNYKNGLPGRLGVAQFNSGSAIVEIASPGMNAQIHTKASELRQFAATLIAAADAFDAEVEALARGVAA
jgi:hypothetical protein